MTIFFWSCRILWSLHKYTYGQNSTAIPTPNILLFIYVNIIYFIIITCKLSINDHKDKNFIIICITGIAWIIIPQTFKIENEYFLFKSWNLFVVVCSLPSIIVSCLLMGLPESPKFLLTQGKHDETIDCLKFVHRWNNKSDGIFPVSPIDWYWKNWLFFFNFDLMPKNKCNMCFR